tara:strand:- start:66584 stop:66928 length:345 start_codon:yes stop_codon:yes gene_type:complete
VIEVQQFNLSKTEKRELVNLLLDKTSISPMDAERKNIEKFKADFKIRLMKASRKNQDPLKFNERIMAFKKINPKLLFDNPKNDPRNYCQEENPVSRIDGKFRLGDLCSGCGKYI